VGITLCNAIGGTYYGDNSSSCPGCVVGQPDLIAYDLSVEPNNGSPDDVILASWKAKNDGGAAAGSSTQALYWSVDSIMNRANDLRIDSDGLPTTDPDEIDSEEETVIIPSNATPGTYYLAVYMDDEGDVSESNENNNWSNIVTVTVNSVAPNGACCLATQCTDKTEAQCSADGGAWFQTLCNNTNCPQAPDSTPPTVAITNPSSNPHSINTQSVNLSGTATDNIGVISVTWRNAQTAQEGLCTVSGTTWSKSGISLILGQNVITITARDAANNTATASITVIYDPGAPPPTLAITSIQPNPVIGTWCDLKELTLSGEGFVAGASIRAAWTGGSKLLEESQKFFDSANSIRVRLITGSDADTWTLTITNPSGEVASSTFSVVQETGPLLCTSTSPCYMNNNSDMIDECQLVSLAINAGFQGNALINAIAVAKAESEFRQFVYNKTHDYGLWQINVDCHFSPAERPAARSNLLVDAAYNAQKAWQISSGGTNWTQWTTWPTIEQNPAKFQDAQLIVQRCLSGLQVGDDYPEQYRIPTCNGLTDDWGFPNRQCTSFVAWRMYRDAQNPSVPFDNFMGGPGLPVTDSNCPSERLSNATCWADRLQKLGFTVDANPTVGSIAHWTGSETPSNGLGHVA